MEMLYMRKFKIKDPVSAATHFAGFLISIPVMICLILKSVEEALPLHVVAFTVFGISLLLLYGASTIYHTMDVKKETEVKLKRIDHMMIFILIAGTYTPVCMIVLGDKTGWTMLTLVWGIAIVGIIINALWITCPKWFSSLHYIAMGWVCILAITKILSSMPRAGFMWLLAGGIIYTIGGIIYALKLPIFNNRHKNFGSHEIFHLFVMAGSACHFIVMYAYLLP